MDEARIRVQNAKKENKEPILLTSHRMGQGGNRMLGLMLLAISVSVDGFFAGMFIAMKKISFPLRSIFIAGMSSGLVIACAMPLGIWLKHVFTTEVNQVIGAIVFIVIGCIAIVHRSPEKADLDQSGEIGLNEAWLLGFMLSIDSFAAGVSAGLLGFTFWLTTGTIALSCSVFIGLGRYMGIQLSRRIPVSLLTYLPGLIFVALGVSKLL